MRSIVRLFTAFVALAFCLCPLFAHAQVAIESLPSTVLYSSYLNPGPPLTVTTAPSNTHTYSQTPAGAWAQPIGSSLWVSFEPNTQPGGSGDSTVLGGYYIYTTTAFSVIPGDTYELEVLADKTTDIMINGGAYTVAPQSSTNCQTGPTPDCVSDSVYIISPNLFTAGTSNTIGFGVSTVAGEATGLDFVLQVDSQSPEPSSFFLLGTGMLGAAGAAYRRVRA